MPLVTRTRRYDGLLVLGVLGLMVCAAPALRVYHQVTVFDVRVVRIEPNGARTVLPTPRALARPSSVADGAPPGVLRELERRIARVMRRDAVLASGGASALEWTIRWSWNSTRLDRTRVLVLPAESGAVR